MFLISFKNSFVYKSSVFFSIFGSVIWIFIQIALWRYIYQHNIKMINYMTVYIIAAGIINLIYSKEMVNYIGGKVSIGNFVYELIKPTNMIFISYQALLGSMAANFIMKGIPQIIIFSPILMKVSYSNILYVLIALVIGHYIYIVLYSLLGLFAFKVFQIWPFTRLLDDTIRLFSGAIIPLSIFPNWLKNISDFLPFRYLFDFPLRLLQDHLSTNDFLIGLTISMCWLIFLTGIMCISYKSIINKCVVQGG